MHLHLKKGDKVIIILVIMLALFAVFQRYIFSKTKSEDVVVKSDGVTVQQRSLEITGTFTIKSKEGQLTFIVQDKKVKVTESTCKDKLCIKQGWISRTGESIVCLPNRITITITGGDESVDTTTY
jgi:hypothetical protein